MPLTLILRENSCYNCGLYFSIFNHSRQYSPHCGSLARIIHPPLCPIQFKPVHCKSANPFIGSLLCSRTGSRYYRQTRQLLEELATWCFEIVNVTTFIRQNMKWKNCRNETESIETPSKENMQLMLKIPDLPDSSQGGFLKATLGVRVVGCLISSWTFFCTGWW